MFTSPEHASDLHPVSVRRFPSFRTQPLESLTLLPMKTWISEQPSPWRKSSQGRAVRDMQRGQTTQKAEKYLGDVWTSQRLEHVLTFSLVTDIGGVRSEARISLRSSGYSSPHPAPLRPANYMSATAVGNQVISIHICNTKRQRSLAKGE